MAVILDGKALSAKFRQNIKEETAALKEKTGKAPGIAVILAGDDAASSVYVNSKEKAAIECGFYSVVERISADVTTSDVLKLVEKYNNDEKTILRAIRAEKDVDGFHPYNVGLLNIGEDCLMPCTPFGVMNMMADYGIDIAGKNAVVVGRSNIVGKPIAAMLLKANATVTVCHSKTKDLSGVCAKADILVAAIGKAKFIKKEFVKDGAVVIDVGINRVDGKLCGDVDFEDVKDKCSYITPVPGGVGPMTITTLMQNTLKAFKFIEKL